VFASSVVARIGVANHEAIAAAKGGLEAMVRSAAATYASRGVRVNAVAPGLVETPLAAAMTAPGPGRDASLRLHPLGRLGQPADIASALELLVENPWLTGQILAVDGGLSLKQQGR
jgi:NAD(P)-dependent dehydrogenase (short-subunit alcohol dehydrogenase family)